MFSAKELLPGGRVLILQSALLPYSMSLRVSIEEHAAGLMFSGQQLKGTLHVTTPSVLTVTAVSILLRGTSKTKFTRTKIEVGAHHGKIGIKPKIETFEQRIVLLNSVFHMERAMQGQVMQLDPRHARIPISLLAAVALASLCQPILRLQNSLPIENSCRTARALSHASRSLSWPVYPSEHC
jgi:hypothetical protein